MTALLIGYARVSTDGPVSLIWPHCDGADSCDVRWNPP